MQTIYLMVIVLTVLLMAPVGEAQEGSDTVWQAEEILKALSKPDEEAVVQPDEPQPAAEVSPPLSTPRETYLSAYEAAIQAGREADPEGWLRDSQQRVDAILKTLRGEGVDEPQDKPADTPTEKSAAPTDRPAPVAPGASQLDQTPEPELEADKQSQPAERRHSMPAPSAASSAFAPIRTTPDKSYDEGFAIARTVRREALGRSQHRVHVYFDGRALVLDGLVRRAADVRPLLDFAAGFGYPVVNRLSVFRPRPPVVSPASDRPRMEVATSSSRLSPRITNPDLFDRIFTPQLID